VLSAMMLYANIQSPQPVRKWETVLSFSKAAGRLLHRSGWMRERPIRFAA
jgi:hypothetical protein